MSVKPTWAGVVLRISVAASACAVAHCGRTTSDAFYAMTADQKVIRIEARGVNDVMTTDVGATGIGGCAAFAQSTAGGYYSVCGPGILKPGPQQLVTVDSKSGHATAVGQAIQGLQIMGMKFAADGKLYTVGDANPASPTYNSLYTLDATSGAVVKVGSTGVQSFFHDLALDGNGAMYATSGDALYTIDLKSGIATKVAGFVGGGTIMGLSFNADHSKLYATDWKQPASDVYLVDRRTGFLTPLGTTGRALAHGLTPAPR